MNRLFEPLASYEPWLAMAKAANGKGFAAVYDMADGQRPFLAAALAEKTGRQVLYIAASDQAAMRAADDCAHLLGGGAGVLPAADMQFARAAASQETAWHRLETLTRAQRGELRVLCAPADALLLRHMPPKRYAEATLTVRVGDRLPPQELIEKLCALGYERVDMVEGKGQCALRGALVDVYPPCEVNALRIECFGDEVDSLREFDCISQRSLTRLQTARLSPAGEFLLSDDMRAPAAERMRTAVAEHAREHPPAPYQPGLPAMPSEDGEPPEESAPIAARDGYARFLADADALARGANFRGMGLWASVLLPETSFLHEWLSDPIVILDAPDRVRARCDDRVAGFFEDFKLALSRQEAVPAQANLLYSADEAFSALDGLTLFTFQDFLRGMAGLSPDAIIRFPGLPASLYQGRLRDLEADVAAWRAEKYAVALLSGGVARGKRMQAALQEMGALLPFDESIAMPAPGEAAILPVTLSRGFILREAGLAVVADADIYGSGYRKQKRRAATSGERIEAFTDLKEGDYVVHEHHGVGIFRGTVRIQSEGTYRDYLYIQYQGNDKLYVPTDQFSRVQKFIGGQGKDVAPALNKLGGGEWQKQKSKVKASLRRLAFDLVQLYAQRKATPGHAFSPNTPWQAQFEDNFPYELTPDQERAIRDVTRDMESAQNMDRLLCGDVGYGKTEVAMRAAFKAVMDGKQVALLAPTTILAQQHYYTLSKRLEGFPVTVDVISRFQSPKRQKETLKNLAGGFVDILVGTHRLLSKDVKFKDLGLLVVDEEQRFGVSHKEVIKNMKHKVDVLTLSATPIPRTLHMSMVGVRDMSLLETPPEERYPVQTYVMDYSDGVIRDAIMRELARGGQVFFLYNRVQSIEAFHARLRALVPEARIAIAHGQMKEHSLEDVMMDFYEGKYDVLLCTTIIENGLDVPLANTLIVFDADRFGLAQLYQLRGRVGRSNRVAYAYFTVRPDKMLSETAEKRLSAIREFTEFGAGFRIAMRDLEIRGAGNIFGPEQSGQVSTVGYDMYCKLIEEAVREAQGDQDVARESELETRVDLQADAFLPTEYVGSEGQRMEVYKRIALIRTREDREDVIEELIDRFGDPPVPVMNLIEIAHLRALCARLGVSHVSYARGALVMRLEMKYVRSIEALYAAMEQTDARLSLSAGKTPAMLLRETRLPQEELLRAAVPIAEKLVARVEALRESAAS